MALTAVDKMKLTKYLKERTINQVYYVDMCDYLGKRGKITDIEFLDYFVGCVMNEFRKSEKISTKQAFKMISIIEAFVYWINQAKSEISEELLDKVRSLNDFYNEYLTRNGFEPDENIVTIINSVLDTTNELYPTQGSSESVSKYINQISDLESKIKELDKELTSLTRLYENLQSSYEQKSEKVDSLYAETVTLGREIRSKNQDISVLAATIDSLNAKISELENIISSIQKENESLLVYKETAAELKRKVKGLWKKIDDAERAKKNAAKLEAKESEIESLIYQKLLLGEATLDEIVKYVCDNKIASNSEDVARLLKQVRQRINISTSSFSITPVYQLENSRLIEDGKFTINVPDGCKYYDIMLVSDFHIKEFDHKVIRGFDALNDYCTKNGISLVLNLGDFYQGFSARPLDYANAIKNYNMVEKSIKFIPKAKGVYHAILGGNHERNIANYGFDPIGLLSSERDDFLSLGYHHSTISLNNSDSTLGLFDIHHPNTFDFPISFDENGMDIADISKYLMGVYARQGRSRDDSYIDLLGHTHRSQFNYPGSYYFLPPFLEGGNKKGACHLRIYFDEKTGIKYMVFMPLQFNATKLVQNNEIVYQKQLTKK